MNIYDEDNDMQGIGVVCGAIVLGLVMVAVVGVIAGAMILSLCVGGRL